MNKFINKSFDSYWYSYIRKTMQSPLSNSTSVVSNVKVGSIVNHFLYFFACFWIVSRKSCKLQPQKKAYLLTEENALHQELFLIAKLPRKNSRKRYAGVKIMQKHHGFPTFYDEYLWLLEKTYRLSEIDSIHQNEFIPTVI